MHVCAWEHVLTKGKGWDTGPFRACLLRGRTAVYSFLLNEQACNTAQVCKILHTVKGLETRASSLVFKKPLSLSGKPRMEYKTLTRAMVVPQCLHPKSFTAEQ